MRFFIVIIFASFSFQAYSQDTAYDWYKKIMLHLAKKEQSIKAKIQVSFADERILEYEYKYAISGKNFYAHFSNRDVILTKKWFVNLSTTDELILIDKNSNENSSEKRMSKLLDGINKNLLDEGFSTDFYSLHKYENGLMKLEINYPSNESLFTRGILIFNPKNLEIEKGEFSYSKENTNRSTDFGEMDKISFRYEYKPFLKSEYISLNDVVNIESNTFQLRNIYNDFKVYNMSGLEFIDK